MKTNEKTINILVSDMVITLATRQLRSKKMIKKKYFTRGIFGLLIVMGMVTRLYADGVHIDCPVSRTIIPLTYDVGFRTTSAASFMYGEYLGELHCLH